MVADAVDVPSHFEQVIDGDIQTIAPFITYYEDMVGRVEEEYEGEMRPRVASNERPVLLLYSRSTCPYCQRVFSFLDEIGKRNNVPVKDIGQDPGAGKELMDVTGRRQVPCLKKNDEYLFESIDIIRWLDDNQDKY